MTANRLRRITWFERMQIWLKFVAFTAAASISGADAVLGYDPMLTRRTAPGRHSTMSKQIKSELRLRSRAADAHRYFGTASISFE